ncbi:hypothetical protein AMECASPLE_037216 [Ameca splendens]|uniref:Uncharacterized protein n=1 Tax=Ameca splendens TaxID=208324 RepID=A0ABV0YW93_9TELE
MYYCLPAANTYSPLGAAKILQCGGYQVFPISISLEEYKKVEMSALQCLGNFKSWSLVPVTLCSGSKSSVWILPQPKCSSLRRNPFWNKPQLTAQDLHPQASEPCSPSTNYPTESSPEHSPPPWTNSPVPQQHKVSPPRLHIILPLNHLFI